MEKRKITLTKDGEARVSKTEKATPYYLLNCYYAIEVNGEWKRQYAIIRLFQNIDIRFLKKDKTFYIDNKDFDKKPYTNTDGITKDSYSRMVGFKDLFICIDKEEADNQSIKEDQNFIENLTEEDCPF